MPRSTRGVHAGSGVPFGIAAVLVALALVPAPPPWYAVGALGIVLLLVALLPRLVGPRPVPHSGTHDAGPDRPCGVDEPLSGTRCQAANWTA